MSEKITGAEVLIKSLIAEGVDTIFGYPGGAIIPVFDKLYDCKKEINHVLVRHEQGAAHAAQGFARVSGKTGVVVVTSGPGATNVITGLSDAMMDSTPLVVITGQISSSLLGTDAFQEVDVIGVTQPVTKWSYQIRKAEDIQWAVARAFYIASTGRPGPVVLDFAKNAQNEFVEWKEYNKCEYIRSYIPYPKIDEAQLDNAAQLINSAQRPMIISGQGVCIANAEDELRQFAEKAEIPVACTLLGLSTMPSSHPLNKGMLGMHGYIAPNMATNRCDVLIAVGMRFDDRVTGDAKRFATQAKVVHIDIDESEFNKNVHADAPIHGDAKTVLAALLPKISKTEHKAWLQSFEADEILENEKIVKPELNSADGLMRMGEVAAKVSEMSGNKAILVTDVGQNQMLSSRYFRFTEPRSIVTSGGLGTMGFGLPAAIGAAVGSPSRTVCFFTGDGGIQMTVEELGVIMQFGIKVKIVILNNNFLGMVRQWQELFYDKRYSQTAMENPNFVMLANAYGIPAENVATRGELEGAIQRMLSHDGAYVLNVNINPAENVFPMVPAGSVMTETMLSETEKYKN